jgi:hypothetical protein
MVRVLRGKPISSGGHRRPPTLRERMEAANWLADHGWGRPVLATEMPELEARTVPDREATPISKADLEVMKAFVMATRQPRALPEAQTNQEEDK